MQKGGDKTLIKTQEKAERGGVISSRTLIRRLMAEVSKVRKIKSDDPKMICTRARTIGYLISVASQVLEKHEYEERLDNLEKIVEEQENGR